MRWFGFKANQSTSYPRSGQFSKNGVRFLSLAFIIFGIITGYSSFREVHPEYSSLKRVDGQVTWIRYYKSAISFRLRIDKNTEMYFTYALFGGDGDNVYTTLAKQDGRSISVLFDPEENRAAFFSDEESFSIYELSLSGSSIPFQSYSRIKKGWIFNNRVGYALGIVLILVGLWLPSITRNYI